MTAQQEWTDEPRFTNITQIKDANKAAGMFWFSPATIKCFKARVETRVYTAKDSRDYPQGSRVWVESTWTGEEARPRAREYKIPRFDVASSDISYVNVDYRTLVFTTKGAAVTFLTENLL